MATDVESDRFHLTRRVAASASAPSPIAEDATKTGKDTERLGVLGILFGALAVVLLAGVAATCVGLAGLAVVKSVDVFYAGMHFVRHWSDEQAAPPNAELCKGLFCRRADTELKHVAGSAGKQSERFAAFCPEHGRSDFL